MKFGNHAPRWFLQKQTGCCVLLHSSGPRSITFACRKSRSARIGLKLCRKASSFSKQAPGSPKGSCSSRQKKKHRGSTTKMEKLSKQDTKITAPPRGFGERKHLLKWGPHVNVWKNAQGVIQKCKSHMFPLTLVSYCPPFTYLKNRCVHLFGLNSPPPSTSPHWLCFSGVRP